MRVTELHWSSLKHIAQSPAHFREALLRPKAPTPAMQLGTVVHDIVLGGEGFVVWQGKRQGKAWEAFEDQHKGKLIVTATEFARAEAAALAVLHDPVAVGLLDGAKLKEHKWRETIMGRPAAGRIDIVGEDYLVELKTTASAEPGKFARQCLQMGYHAQLAWYRAAMPRPRAIIIGVETKAPYPVTVFELSERALVEGEKLNRLWVERLNACEEADAWPAYAQSVLPLDVAEDAGLEFDAEEGEAA